MWSFIKHYKLIFLVMWQNEIEELRSKLSNASVTPNDSMRKMKEGYLQKLNVLDEQVISSSIRFAYLTEHKNFK